MACTNCFNGCSEVVSDKCVKYTGNDIPSLGVSKGDSLNVVNTKLTEYLLSVISGARVFPSINNDSLCNLVSSFLPSEGSISLVQIVDALIKSVCSLQEQIIDVAEGVATIEADYTIGSCIEDVNSDSGTHAILQAAITKLCALNTAYNAFVNSVNNGFVKINDIDDYIQAYLDSIGTTSLVSAKMVPYVALEYYGPLDNFDVTGKGLNDWDKVYLCNGNNGTPDKRGRVAVGTTTGMGGGAFPAQTDPALPGNPTYTLNSTQGTNQVTLTENQIPAHTHNNTVGSTISPATHNHGWTGSAGTGFPDGNGNTTTAGTTNSYVKTTKEENVTLSVNTTITNVSVGGGLAHTNIQPSLACHYIIYLP